MKIVVFGDGLVGLVTAASLAEKGSCVVCVPLDSFKQIECNEQLINDEPGLSVLVDAQLLSGRLVYEMFWHKQMKGCNICFISLPSRCLTVADDIVKYIAKNIQGNVIIVSQSAFPIGTAERFESIINNALNKRDANYCVSVVAMPAFLSEGEAIKNFANPDRILLGASSENAAVKVSELMQSFGITKDKIQLMSTKAAEYSKFAVNAVLATRMSLINEMANIAEGFDVDFEQVKKALGADSRIGFDYISPGCGFGGPNFAVDVSNLVRFFLRKGYDIPLLKKVLESNENQKEVMFRKVWRYFNADIKNKTFAVWGLSFKPNTSTVENGSSLKTIKSLLAQGAKVVVYDPKAMSSFKLYYQTEQCSVIYSDDMYSALGSADGLLLLTDWKQFYNPDFTRMKALMKTPAIFDGRNVFEPNIVIKHGFDYFGVGSGQKI